MLAWPLAAASGSEKVSSLIDTLPALFWRIVHVFEIPDQYAGELQDNNDTCCDTERILGEDHTPKGTPKASYDET